MEPANAVTQDFLVGLSKKKPGVISFLFCSRVVRKEAPQAGCGCDSVNTSPCTCGLSSHCILLPTMHDTFHNFILTLSCTISPLLRAQNFDSWLKSSLMGRQRLSPKVNLTLFSPSRGAGSRFLPI